MTQGAQSWTEGLEDARDDIVSQLSTAVLMGA